MEKAEQTQRFVERVSQTVHDRRQEYLRLATSFYEAEGALIEERDCVHKLIAKTAAATSAMSVGSGDRARDEMDYSLGVG